MAKFRAAANAAKGKQAQNAAKGEGKRAQRKQQE